MNFDLTAEQLAVKQRAARFVDEVCAPLEASWAADDYDMPPMAIMELARKFREYGLRGLSVPEAAGGLGMGTLAKCLAYEEIVRSRVVHGSLATWSGLMEPHPALYDASEKQKEKYLYPLLRDEKFYHINISEPEVGSDAAAIATRAIRDGDHYVINGIKRWAPPPSHPAVRPSYLLCYAVTDPSKGHDGISLFLVDYPNPGVRVVKEFDTMGSGFLGRAADYEYKDCRVPAENLLGSEGMGFRYMMDQLNRNRLVIGARLAGVARWAQNRALSRAKERVAFGKPLADQQAIQWMLAESEIEIEQMRLMVYKAAWLMDEGADVRKEAAMVKCFAPLAACRVIDRAMQIHGGSGVVKETGLAQLYAESRISQIAEGSTEMMKITIARQALRAHASG